MRRTINNRRRHATKRPIQGAMKFLAFHFAIGTSSWSKAAYGLMISQSATTRTLWTFQPSFTTTTTTATRSLRHLHLPCTSSCTPQKSFLLANSSSKDNSENKETAATSLPPFLSQQRPKKTTKRRNFKKPPSAEAAAASTSPKKSIIRINAKKRALVIIANFIHSWSIIKQKNKTNPNETFSNDDDDDATELQRLPPSSLSSLSSLKEESSVKLKLATEKLKIMEKELQEERAARLKSNQLLQNATSAMEEAEAIIKRQEEALFDAEEKAECAEQGRANADKVIQFTEKQLKELKKIVQDEVSARKEAESNLKATQQKVNDDTKELTKELNHLKKQLLDKVNQAKMHAKKDISLHQQQLKQEQLAHAKAEEVIQTMTAKQKSTEIIFQKEKDSLLSQVEKAKKDAQIKAMDYHELLQRIRVDEKTTHDGLKMELEQTKKQITSMQAQLQNELNTRLQFEKDLATSNQAKHTAETLSHEANAALQKAQESLGIEIRARKNAEGRALAQEEDYRKLKERAKAEVNASRIADMKYKKAESELRHARLEIKQLLREVKGRGGGGEVVMSSIADEIAQSLAEERYGKDEEEDAVDGDDVDTVSSVDEVNKEQRGRYEEYDYMFGNLD